MWGGRSDGGGSEGLEGRDERGKGGVEGWRKEERSDEGGGQGEGGKWEGEGGMRVECEG